MENQFWNKIQSFQQNYLKYYFEPMKQQVAQETEQCLQVARPELAGLQILNHSLVSLICEYLDVRSPLIYTYGNNSSDYGYRSTVSDDIMAYGLSISFKNHGGHIRYYDGSSFVQLYWNIFLTESEMKNGRMIITSCTSDRNVLNMKKYDSGDIEVDCSYKNGVLHGAFSSSIFAGQENISCTFDQGTLASGISFNLDDGYRIIDQKSMNQYFERIYLLYLYLPTW